MQGRCCCVCCECEYQRWLHAPIDAGFGRHSVAVACGRVSFEARQYISAGDGEKAVVQEDGENERKLSPTSVSQSLENGALEEQDTARHQRGIKQEAKDEETKELLKTCVCSVYSCDPRLTRGQCNSTRQNPLLRDLFILSVMLRDALNAFALFCTHHRFEELQSLPTPPPRSAAVPSLFRNALPPLPTRCNNQPPHPQHGGGTSR